ncbi:hypothetical protein Smp_010850 [Schistosoma mansoni]|uniref:hypothetical protein n=1 Tax=Schistosoma mansoni TaxID=6183 RepID=UPI00022DC19E|nr:hypothetical protein Smp_010850 [Schistosoma mansoni]|eukprot:XP_018652022.1 hypothetical protein Smp_010850 [Schistosoma mansoni]
MSQQNEYCFRMNINCDWWIKQRRSNTRSKKLVWWCAFHSSLVCSLIDLALHSPQNAYHVDRPVSSPLLSDNAPLPIGIGSEHPERFLRLPFSTLLYELVHQGHSLLVRQRL